MRYCTICQHMEPSDPGCNCEAIIAYNKLNPFEQWCVRSNLDHAKTEGLENVVAQLHANGYPRVAEVVRGLGGR